MFGLRLGLGAGGRAPFDFYVDSVSGNDGNNGETIATAFQTLSATETAALVHGDGVRIGLVYGSAWSETIDLSALSNVIVDVVGTKSNGLPVMRGDAAMGAVWEDSGDRADAFTNTYSQDLAWGASGYPLVFEDGVALTFRDTTTLVDANAGSFTVSGGTGVIAASTQTYYVHPVGSTNPGSDGKTYEYSTLIAPQFGAAPTVKNVWFKRFGSRNGVASTGVALLHGCLFEDHSTHDALPESGEYRKCVGWHGLSDSREGHVGLEFFHSTGAGKTVKWNSCIYVGLDGATQNLTAFGGHTGGALYDSAKAIDCSAKFCNVSLSGVSAVVTLTRPHVVDCPVGASVQVDGATSNTITDLWLEYGGPSTGIDCSDVDVTIDGLRYYGDNTTAAIGAFSGNTTLSKSVIVGSGGEFRRRGPWDAAGVLVMTGTIFDTVSGTWQAVKAATVTGSDGNVFYPDVHYTVEPTLYTDLATLRSSESVEATSVDTDPAIADAANGDFTVGGSVPAGAGLERDVTCQLYTPIPASLAAAETWILANT